MAVDHVEVTALSSGAFTEVVSAPGALGVPVPSCPEWTVADLVRHLGEVQGWWTLALRGNGSKPNTADLSTPGPDLLSWWRQCSGEFLTTLRATPTDAPAWCWWNDAQRDTAGAVAWRQAHEAVVHLWDAQAALGAQTPIGAEVAADGVDEFVARMLP
ncbi:MAG TPA: maleylpyruvate isomerase family mycothiol-dependent enzyme, partial [Pseudonocardiaceae bacterium]